MASNEHLFKILVIGDISVGKTSIIKRYVHDIFSENYKSTIGVDFALKVLPFKNDVVVRIQLWDIAGQERFGNMTKVYYKEALGAVIVYDATRPSTYNAASKWKTDLDSKIFIPGTQTPLPTILLRNKVDILSDDTSTEGLDSYCKEHGFEGWFNTSAKTNVGIDAAFEKLVSSILKVIPDKYGTRPTDVVSLYDDDYNNECACEIL